MPWRPPPVEAQAPLQLRITFQPDCFRAPSSSTCDRLKLDGQAVVPRTLGQDRIERIDAKTVAVPDLRPQIAIWLEKADGSFVDSIYVTNATAVYGIGNRPGHWRLPSTMRFPYGKRVMVLPVWAHRRGKLYDNLIMQDGVDKESWLGFHELVSSTEKYFCRPLTARETTVQFKDAEIKFDSVDAVTCPSPNFNSAKGRYVRPTDYRADDPNRVPQKTYYPPRNDLRITAATFSRADCDEPNQQTSPTCPAAVRSFEQVNDLDLVAAATPTYGRPVTKMWTVPTDLPSGNYVVWLEINKEFDGNAAHSYPAMTDAQLADAGLKNNFGQPSVVFRVPIRIDREAADQGAVTEIAGYGEWDGKSGTLNAADNTISDSPGSGKGRLLPLPQPSIYADGAPLVGRLHVSTTAPVRGSAPPPADGGGDPGSDADAGVPGGGLDGGAGGSAAPGSCTPVRAAVTALVAPASRVVSEAAEIQFVEPAGPAHALVQEYEIRIWEGLDTGEAAFRSGKPETPAGPGAAGETRTVPLHALQPQTQYTVGVRPTGLCIDGEITYTSFLTVTKKFTQLSGCFIATAAYGSRLAAEVEVLRRARDRARSVSALADAAVDLYERSSPPLAHLVGASPSARAVVRELLAPLTELIRAGGATP